MPPLANVSPYREIGSAKNVEVKISKMFQKGIKLKFLKGHLKIFHNNIFIFQPYTVARSGKVFKKSIFLKILLRKHK